MPKEHGRLRIYAPRAGTVTEARNTLAAIEEAYLQFYAADVYVGALNEAYYRQRPRIPFELFQLGLLFPWQLHARHAISTNEIRRLLVIAEDQLELSAVEFGSPGFWEFLGSLNPLDQLRKYLADRHERKKDKDYRNTAEQTRLDLENERLAVEVFTDKVEALQKAGWTNDEIRRLLLPAARSLNRIADAQDRGLIEGAEFITIEDQRESES